MSIIKNINKKTFINDNDRNDLIQIEYEINNNSIFISANRNENDIDIYVSDDETVYSCLYDKLNKIYEGNETVSDEITNVSEKYYEAIDEKTNNYKESVYDKEIELVLYELNKMINDEEIDDLEGKELDSIDLYE